MGSILTSKIIFFESIIKKQHIIKHLTLSEVSTMSEIKSLFQSCDFSTTDFSEKTVLITGAGRGIGQACAEAFAALGARVIIAEISQTGAQIAKKIQENGGICEYIHTDVQDSNCVTQMVSSTLEIFGGIDIVINNAIRVPVCNVVDMDEALWDAVINTNLKGTFLVCKAVLPGMLKRGSGVIINMISTDAMPGLSAYIASKQGISGFTRSLAAEVGKDDIQVIAFAPGMVQTPGIQEVAKDLAPQLGLSENEFLNMPLHAAYEGLMPVEHAALATIYLTKNLAKKYHGEEVTGYEVLEEAGIIVSESASPSIGLTSHIQTNSDPDLSALLVELKTIIREISEEFEKLPVFIRPLARSGFKKKAILSVQNWQRYVEQLVQTNSVNANFDHERLLKRLTPLENYIQGVPAETARFTKDEQFLNEVTITCQNRLIILQAIKSKFE
jgi:NAD(P)-dependent dehydrogenase (short-subunit alcohol dehydrogenase family)